ncbi:MAG: hypothetical protein ACREQV_26025 [Candidatus Binatia bacterium]
MLEAQNYATLLRPIGQMLEDLRIESFAVRPDRDGFVIRDRTRNRAQLTRRERAFLAELHLSNAEGLDKEDAFRLAAGVFEWHVMESDVERFEREGREKRRSGEQAPDSHSVSQVLRVIGTILDQKRGQMSYVSKDEQVVTIEYELPGGRMVTEQYDAPTLYDFWVRMYKKRTPRNGDAHLTA